MRRLRDEVGLRPAAFSDLAETADAQLAFWSNRLDANAGSRSSANGQRQTANG